VGRRLSLLHRLTASAERLDAVELQEKVEQRCCVPVSQLQRGKSVEVMGRLRAVVYTPSETVPTLEAELFDGSDSLDLVWLGRRRIAGVEPGRRVVARGRVGVHNGRLAIYNPWYELLTPGA
jgi:RecJ-like exonuclease